MIGGSAGGAGAGATSALAEMAPDEDGGNSETDTGEAQQEGSDAAEADVNYNGADGTEAGQEEDTEVIDDDGEFCSFILVCRISIVVQLIFLQESHFFMFVFDRHAQFA